MIRDEDRQAWREAAAAATPGSWSVYRPSESTLDFRIKCDSYVPGSHAEARAYVGRLTCAADPRHNFGGINGARPPAEADAKFIAIARTAVPALLEENDELRAKIHALEARIRGADP